MYISLYVPQILDADNARWEPPSPLQHRKVPKISASSSANTEYDYAVRIPKMDKPFGFSVLRNSREILYVFFSFLLFPLFSFFILFISLFVTYLSLQC